MLYRKAGVGDIPLIRELTFKIWPTTYDSILSKPQIDYMLEMMYSIPSLEHQISSLEHQFIIGYESDEPVAFASYSPSPNEASVYRLHKIYILSSMQGKGAGKEMIQYIINEIVPAGAAILELNVNRSNSARSFYEKMGFTVYRTEDNEIGNGYYMNDYVMRKQL